MHVNDAELRALACGAMDPARALAVNEEIAADPALAARFARIRDALAAATESPWRIPPPRLGSFSLQSAPAMVMGTSSRIRLTIPRDAAPPHHLVVILGLYDAAWEPLFPASAGEAIHLSDLATEGEDYVIDVVKGPTRWAIALPESIDWSAGWQGLQTDIAAGRTAVAALAG